MQQQQQQQSQHELKYDQMPHAVPVQAQPPYIMQGDARLVQLQWGGAEAHHVNHQLHPMRPLQQQQQYVHYVLQPLQQGPSSIMIQQPPMMGGMQQEQQPQQHTHHHQQPRNVHQQPLLRQPPSLRQQPQPQPPWVPVPGKVDVPVGRLGGFSEQFDTGSRLIEDDLSMHMTSTRAGPGPVATKKRSRKVTESLTKEETKLRKERNIVHARNSRLRRKLLLEFLRYKLIGLRRENTLLRQVVKQRCGRKAPEIFEKIILAAVLSRTGEGEDGKDPATNENDQKLMLALQKAQQSLTVCSATSPNTNMFASKSFLDLTGYTLNQVVGRPLLFLKGVGTSDIDLEMVSNGIAEGRDTTVCLLNYKADGTAFWNQMFVAPLLDAQHIPICFVAVHCDIKQCSLDNELQAIVKKTSVDIMEKFLCGN